ncbi:MAG: hypothetical protein NTX50_11510 [Candidatus Sumerlaeota bacterium]|nr:hypothetical protein [Candidatus Sumerlaeota bacterium]
MNLRLLSALILIWMGTIASGSISVCPAQDRASAPAGKAAPGDEFFPLNEIKPGLKGYGLSVFSGTKPERFDVEILGIIKGSLGPRYDMIICKCSHPRLDQIGVVAGMSGSPVFINDKLVGALGYGWTSLRQAIGGIAPIQYMMEVYDQVNAAPHPKPYSAPGFAQPGSDSGLNPLALPPVRLDASNAPSELFPDAASAAQGITLEPLATPLLISACSPWAMKLARETFAPYGFQVIQAGGSGGATGEDDKIGLDEIGSGYALAIPILRGDMNMSAAGTVTYRKGDKLVAFGHPMFFQGNVDLPMAAGRIHAIMPSIIRPFKLASALNIIGTLRQDRLLAVGGVVGLMPRMIPLTVHIEAPDRKTQRDFHFEAVQDKQFLPMAAATALGESITALSKADGEQSVDVRYSIVLSDGAVLAKHNFVSGLGIGGSVAIPVMMDCRTLLINPFKEVAFSRIEMTARVTDRLREAQALSLRPLQPVYKPGDKAQARVILRSWRAEEESFDLEIQLPEDLEDGSYPISLYDARGRMSLEASRSPGRTQPQTFEQMLDLMKIHYPGNQTYLVLEQPRAQGLTIRGDELPSLPPSMMTVLNTGPKEFISPMRTTILAESRREWPFEISGMVRESITINKYGKR